MKRLSKEDRKRLRHEIDKSLCEEDVYFTVVSPKATLKVTSPAHMILEAEKIGVRLAHREIDITTHILGVPGELDLYSLVIGYGQIDENSLQSAQQREWIVNDPQRLALGTPTITYRGKVRLDPAIDFLSMTLTRVLGRLTHGVLISNMVCDDWLAWSLDYMDRDMFKVTRIYDEPPPDYRSLIQRFPQLRAML